MVVSSAGSSASPAAPLARSSMSRKRLRFDDPDPAIAEAIETSAVGLRALSMDERQRRDPFPSTPYQPPASDEPAHKRNRTHLPEAQLPSSIIDATASAAATINMTARRKAAITSFDNWSVVPPNTATLTKINIEDLNLGPNPTKNKIVQTFHHLRSQLTKPVRLQISDLIEANPSLGTGALYDLYLDQHMTILIHLKGLTIIEDKDREVLYKIGLLVKSCLQTNR